MYKGRKPESHPIPLPLPQFTRREEVTCNKEKRKFGVGSIPVEYVRYKKHQALLRENCGRRHKIRSPPLKARSEKPHSEAAHKLVLDTSKTKTKNVRTRLTSTIHPGVPYLGGKMMN